MTGVYGIVLAVERDVPAGGTWLTFGLAVLLGLAALLVLKSAARPESTSIGPERESMTPASSQSADLEGVAGALLERSAQIGGIDLACLLLIDEDTRRAWV